MLTCKRFLVKNRLEAEIFKLKYFSLVYVEILGNNCVNAISTLSGSKIEFQQLLHLCSSGKS